MAPVVLGRRFESSGVSLPRLNVVSVAVLIASVVLGLFGSIATRNPVRCWR